MERGGSNVLPISGYHSHFRVFSDVQEKQLVTYLTKSADMYFGLCPKEVKKLAYQLARRSNCKYPGSWDKMEMAGKDWFRGFMRRNKQLSLRHPEPTSLSRATSFNRFNVDAFFKNLSDVLKCPTQPFEAQDVWNMDETGITTVQTPDRIVSRENGVVLLSFPPHCSHKLQPLDRTVYGPLKRFISSAINNWLKKNPGTTFGIYDVPAVVISALPLAATPSNIMSSFRVSGIYPFNPQVFTDEEFSPSNVTDRPDPSVSVPYPAGAVPPVSPDAQTPPSAPTTPESLVVPDLRSADPTPDNSTQNDGDAKHRLPQQGEDIIGLGLQTDHRDERNKVIDNQAVIKLHCHIKKCGLVAFVQTPKHDYILECHCFSSSLTFTVHKIDVLKTL
ncbi:uncharacterized protein V6R79_012743 [Siganus canaliculatus]